MTSPSEIATKPGEGVPSFGGVWARFRRKHGLGPAPDFTTLASERYMQGPMRAAYEAGLRRGYLLGRGRSR